MNKGAKIALIVVAVLVIAGIGFTVIGIASVGKEVVKATDYSLEIDDKCDGCYDAMPYKYSTYVSAKVAPTGYTYMMITYEIKNTCDKNINVYMDDLKVKVNGQLQSADVTLSLHQMQGGTCYKSGGYTIVPDGKVTFTLVYEVVKNTEVTPMWTGSSLYKVTFV